MMSRRSLLLAATGATCSGAAPRDRQRRTVIAAPSNLGLRPEGTREPGTWRAPARLLEAGLQGIVGARDVAGLERPRYQVAAQRGTRIRNGRTIRDFSLRLGGLVRERLARGDFPIVLGGDCSICSARCTERGWPDAAGSSTSTDTATSSIPATMTPPRDLAPPRGWTWRLRQGEGKRC